jgi:hypothetical protein
MSLLSSTSRMGASGRWASVIVSTVPGDASCTPRNRALLAHTASLWHRSGAQIAEYQLPGERPQDATIQWVRACQHRSGVAVPGHPHSRVVRGGGPGTLDQRRGVHRMVQAFPNHTGMSIVAFRKQRPP